jgi:hypothetical protein
MPESIVHAQLVWYLVAVLKWLFHDSMCAICENFAFFPPLEHPGPSVAPAIAVISSGLAPGCPRYRHFIGRMTSFGIILDTEAVIVR